MSYLIVCTMAFAASALTFFSGFGLGTLLLPAFALFFAVEQAVALTAVVHFLNGVFKLVLVWRHVAWPVVLRFGLPALVAAFAGASLLVWLADVKPILTYSAFGRPVAVAPAKLTVGVLLLCFACAELLPSVRAIAFPRRWLPLGGLLSGFFGGLAGMQGALRSAFLIKAGLSKEAYVATSAAIAFLIDLSRLAVYSTLILAGQASFEFALLTAAVLSALAGSLLGNRFLPEATIGGLRVVVSAMLFIVALGLVSGLL